MNSCEIEILDPTTQNGQQVAKVIDVLSRFWINFSLKNERSPLQFPITVTEVSMYSINSQSGSKDWEKCLAHASHTMVCTENVHSVLMLSSSSSLGISANVENALDTASFVVNYVINVHIASWILDVESLALNYITVCSHIPQLSRVSIVRPIFFHVRSAHKHVFKFIVRGPGSLP